MPTHSNMETTNHRHLARQRQKNSFILNGLSDLPCSSCRSRSMFILFVLSLMGKDYLKISTPSVVNSEASDIQKEVERTLLPFTVEWRARTSLGST